MHTFKYDAWLIWTITLKCNIDCAYCCVEKYKTLSGNRPVNIAKVIKNLNSTGKTFKVDLTGGEPLIVPNIMDVMEIVMHNHYISFNSNMISTRIKDICRNLDCSKINFINASLHIHELEKRNLVDRFLNHIVLCRDKAIPLNCVIVAYPGYADCYEKYKNILTQNNINISILPFYGLYKEKKYPESYSKEELAFFNIREETFEGEKRYFRNNKLCNAGYNVASADTDGTVYICQQVKKKLGNIYKKFHFQTHLIQCPSSFCACPVVLYDVDLYNQALSETLPVNEKNKRQEKNG